MTEINIEYFNNMIEEIEKYDDCSIVNEKLLQVKQQLQAQIDSITSNLQVKELIDIVLNPPNSIDDVLNYINNLIQLFIRIYAPYYKTYETQVELLTQYVRLYTAISNKITNLQCNIDLPTL